MNTKRCTNCGDSFPSTTQYFRKLKTGKYGVSSECKKCLSERDNKYRAKNIDRLREYDRQRYPARKEERSAYHKEWYHKNRDAEIQRAGKYKTAHAEKYKEINHKNYIKKIGHFLELAKKWHESHREYMKPFNRAARARRRAKVKANGGSYTPKDVERIYKAQKGRCYYCGVKVGNKYHVDHVVPISRGGSNNPDNLVIACPTCNDKKGAKLPHEWGEGGRLF